MPAKKNIITVDLGGTKILSALLNDKNEIVQRVKTPTNSTYGVKKIVEDIAASINALLEKAKFNQKDIKAISIGVPGTVNPQTGVIAVAPNLGIKDFNIRKAIGKNFSIPVLIENDVNLAALGIKYFEFKDKLKNALVVFVGTGIGGALIFDGKLYRGSSFYAGEIGHMKIDKRGNLSKNKNRTFEETASRTAIVRRINKAREKGINSEILSYVKEGGKIKSSALGKAVKRSDPLITKEVGRASEVIGRVLGSITTLLNVDTIILGGGVVEAMGGFMLPIIRESFSEAVLPEPGKAVKIIATKLGDDAPLYGGVSLYNEFKTD